MLYCYFNHKLDPLLYEKKFEADGFRARQTINEINYCKYNEVFIQRGFK